MELFLLQESSIIYRVTPVHVHIRIYNLSKLIFVHAHNLTRLLSYMWSLLHSGSTCDTVLCSRQAEFLTSFSTIELKFTSFLSYSYLLTWLFWHFSEHWKIKSKDLRFNSLWKTYIFHYLTLMTSFFISQPGSKLTTLLILFNISGFS